MARSTCKDCNYPESTCVCEFITPVSHKTNIIVLQHPSEVKNAKNTVKLMSLISDNIQINVGENEQDFAQIKHLVQASPERCLILFPSGQAKAWQQWQELLNESSKSKFEPEQAHASFTLIVIDGTWKKAKKIFLLNPWLQELNALKIEGVDSNYDIRKTSITGALSTIEATALALQDIENIDIQPFNLALQGLSSTFTKQMPEQVKARYKKG